MNTSIATQFSRAFHEAGAQYAWQYCNLIRFMAVMFVILGTMWSIQHFLSSEAKESEGFMVRLGTRAVRLALALTLFILFLTT